jgi:hypothetical protein
MADSTIIRYSKNPLFGQPGEPEMLPAETLVVQVPDPQPRVLSWEDLTLYLIGLLGGGATGRSALGTILGNCQAAASTGADKFFAFYLAGQTFFTKAQFTGVLAGVSTSIVSAAAKQLVADSWPTV